MRVQTKEKQLRIHLWTKIPITQQEVPLICQ